MRNLLTIVSIVFSLNCFSQTVTWAPDIVKPKETTSGGISFPGTDANNYYVTEYVGSGKKSKEYFTSVDKQTLKTNKETTLDVFFDAGGKEYYQGTDFFMRNKKYSFFLDEDQKEIFDVYSVIQDMGAGKTGEMKSIQKINASKVKAIMPSMSNKEAKRYTMLYTSRFVTARPAYDDNSILTAFISENVDNDYSMVTITEWDENLKLQVSNKYKIPFVATSSYFLYMTGIRDIVKDNNGFCYILLCSPDPADKKNTGGNYWVYQYKLSDPSYSKVFKKEFGKNVTSLQAEFFQDKSGKVYVSNIGMEIESKSDEEDLWHVNTAVIASFDKEGLFQPVFSGRLSNQMMYNFESEKKVDKKGNVNSLRIKSILPAADGGTYVTWQHEWTETGNNADVYHYDNALVQYYNNAKKMLWEKPIYKQQANRSTAEDIYAGMAIFLLKEDLCIVYPDDPKNANKAIDDKDPATFSVVKFGNKDLGGMFVATVTPKGNYTRKYIKWPENRIGYGICTNSFVDIGNNEMIATARKLRQGSIALTSEEYTFLKIKF